MTGRLIVMCRYPEAGRTKTRLIPALGAAGAARLQSDMTRHVLGWVDKFAHSTAANVEIRFAGGDAERMAALFGASGDYRPQGDGNLGRRMARAFGDAFDSGEGPVVMIGTDCPTVTADVLRAAFDALHTADLVLGPAHDGGYYLIGMRRLHPSLLEGIDWGSERVLKQTLNAARRLSLRVELLAERADIDRPEDLPAWERARREHAPPDSRERISVVVPARNEAENLPPVLERLGEAAGVEIIVVDGGSTDGTAEVARQHSARVLTSPPGRARQMNAGADAATGSILLFCHADTLLPSGFDRLIRAALTPGDAGTMGGAFALGIDEPGRGYRWIESAVRWRNRLTRIPYGDQGIFLRHDVFHRLGGFPDEPIMEDYLLMRRLRRVGHIALLAAPALSSGRYWRRWGLWRASLINQTVVLGYHFGLPLAWLARWRRDPGATLRRLPPPRKGPRVDHQPSSSAGATEHAGVSASRDP